MVLKLLCLESKPGIVSLCYTGVRDAVYPTQESFSTTLTDRSFQHIVICNLLESGCSIRLLQHASASNRCKRRLLSC